MQNLDELYAMIVDRKKILKKALIQIIYLPKGSIRFSKKLVKNRPKLSSLPKILVNHVEMEN